MNSILIQTFIYLLAAVIAVPLAKRLGLGSVLGYLTAGIIIGPVTGLVGSETQNIQHFAEFGVVMMLFLIGLGLEPKILWEMRKKLLGLGGLQVLFSIILITAFGLLFDLPWQTSLAIGLIFTMSSTAIVLQTLNETGMIKTEGGRSSFSVLLFQDIALIPILALIPLLALPELVSSSADIGSDHDKEFSLVSGLSGLPYTLVMLSAVTAVIIGGHYLSQPLFRFIAASRLREVFTASALLIVIGIALLMSLVDLSPALGAFLAGVVLATSEFRHELESDIEPFKGILLGLFFITVGAGVDFNILSSEFGLIIGLTIGLIVLKASILLILAWIFKLHRSDGWLFSLGLAQAGEFGFVLLSFSLQNHVIPYELSKTLSLVIALSMLLTPALFIFYDKVIRPVADKSAKPQESDVVDEKGTVIIAGVGRFGQIVNRLLVASGVKTVVLDHELAMIDSLRRFGIKSFYGDASRPDLLQSAGIKDAKLLVIALDDRDVAVKMTEYVRRHYPQVKIIARAFDVSHLYILKKAGVDFAVREMFESSLEAGSEALKLLDLHPFRVEKMIRAFRKHDLHGVDQLYEVWDEDETLARNHAYLARAREHGETLRTLLESDRLQLHDRSERGWMPPPKDYSKELADQE
jgi:monovalent cation:proton antiporter-2 (CPA2) family protein